MCVLDGREERLCLHVFAGSSRTETDSLALHDGVSEVMVVSDEARTLVLLDGDLEVRRLSVHLLAGEVNVIRP